MPFKLFLSRYVVRHCRAVSSISNIGSHLGSDPSPKGRKPIAGSSVPFGTTFIDQQHGNYIGRGGERTSIHGPLVIALAEMDFTSVSTDLWYGQHGIELKKKGTQRPKKKVVEGRTQGTI